MFVGKSLANKTMVDAMGKIQEKVIIDQNGEGEFSVDGGSVSVWITEDAQKEI